MYTRVAIHTYDTCLQVTSDMNRLCTHACAHTRAVGAMSTAGADTPCVCGGGWGGGCDLLGILQLRAVPQLNLPARKSENGTLESPLSTPRSGSAFLAHANSARSSTNSGSGVDTFVCVCGCVCVCVCMHTCAAALRCDFCYFCVSSF